MHQAETQLCWYKILHEKVLELIQQHFRSKEISILDAGCGTGGLLLYLLKNGFLNIQGFDYSDEAISLCLTRNLPVIKADITNFENKVNKQFDLIICNDVLYQFEDEDISVIFTKLTNQLKPDGKIISNNQAFNIFSGTHDIAVGSKQRFTITQIQKILNIITDEYFIKHYTYWSLFLSPLILIIRVLQKIKLRFGLIDKNKISSDVTIPSKFLNNTLYKIAKFENRILKKSPFGSSLLFMIDKKINSIPNSSFS